MKIKDLKKPLETFKRRLGFAASYHNHTHTKESYSISETQFKELCIEQGFKENIDFKHEVKFKFLFLGKRKTYHLDFFFMDKRINVEINPLFHYSYIPVVIRDKLRRLLLRKRSHVRQFNIKVKMFKRKGTLITELNRKYALNVIKQIKEASISRESLMYYLRGKLE